MPAPANSTGPTPTSTRTSPSSVPPATSPRPCRAEFGGGGLTLAELAASQRRLARYAPATALAMSMHSYWIGIAAELEQAGDPSLRWIFDAATAGEVFAAGHAEAGNDIPVLLSTCQAERVEGGYRLTGRKQFGSNGPAWRWLGAHAIDASAPGGPQVVHAFVDRASPGLTVVETWNTLGMRPTQSHDTILDAVFVPDDRIGRVAPAGDGSDLFLVAMAMWSLSLIAAVYLGIADRALELAVASATRKQSMAIPRGAYAYNPFVQHQIAEMYLALDAAGATLDRFVADWTAGVDHGEAWVPKVYSMKWQAVEAAKRVVDIALDVVGGAGMFAGNELERLYRDVRCGGFHPGERCADPRAGRQGSARHPRRTTPVVSVPHHSERSACSTAAASSSTAPRCSAAA